MDAKKFDCNLLFEATFFLENAFFADHNLKAKKEVAFPILKLFCLDIGWDLIQLFS